MFRLFHREYVVKQDAFEGGPLDRSVRQFLEGAKLVYGSKWMTARQITHSILHFPRQPLDLGGSVINQSTQSKEPIHQEPKSRTLTNMKHVQLQMVEKQNWRQALAYMATGDGWPALIDVDGSSEWVVAAAGEGLKKLIKRHDILKNLDRESTNSAGIHKSSYITIRGEDGYLKNVDISPEQLHCKPSTKV